MSGPKGDALPPYLEPDPADSASCLLHIKAVPGARRDEIAGPLGERLKVRVAAAPEDGKANKAICALMAKQLGVRTGAVTLLRGQSNPEKTLRVSGVTAIEAARTLSAGR